MAHRATELYRKRKAAGLCPMCGCERDNSKRAICSKCLAYQRNYYTTRRENQTPEQRDAENERKRIVTYASKIKRRQQGLCVSCGAVSPIHWLCEVCYDRRTGHGYGC